MVQDESTHSIALGLAISVEFSIEFAVAIELSEAMSSWL